MTHRRHLGRYPLLLDKAGIRTTLLTINTDALALHFPNRDGLCPICRVRWCDTRMAALRTLQAAGHPVSVLPPHPPRRPQWDCEGCDEPWPCWQARMMLSDAYGVDRAGLRAHLAELLEQARHEMQHVTESELLDRFDRWTRWAG